MKAEFAVVKNGHLKVYEKLFSCYHDLLVLLQAAVLHVANPCLCQKTISFQISQPNNYFLEINDVTWSSGWVESGRVA